MVSIKKSLASHRDDIQGLAVHHNDKPFSKQLLAVATSLTQTIDSIVIPQ